MQDKKVFLTPQKEKITSRKCWTIPKHIESVIYYAKIKYAEDKRSATPAS